MKYIISVVCYEGAKALEEIHSVQMYQEIDSIFLEL